MSIKIKEVLVEYQNNPLGIDEKKPVFSWLLESDQNGCRQEKCQIQVKSETETVWDTGILLNRESRGIPYEGKDLQPCSSYEVAVTIWDEKGNQAEQSTWFETGFLDSGIGAWSGAKWIAAPRYTVNAKTRGIFVIESEFALEEGSSRGGIVFGANDERLLDANKNEYHLAGENYIRYEIDWTDGEGNLVIYRVGYAKGDSENKPFAKVPLVSFEEGTPVITEENKYEFHTLTVEVCGDQAYAYVDGVLVDAEENKTPFGVRRSGRQLNPRGNNDVITYPRLCEIGFFAGEGDKAYFKNLTVKNLREPGATVIEERPEGKSLYGAESIFDGVLPVEKGCFVAEELQVTVDPTNTSIPMFLTKVQVEEKKELKAARIYMTARGIYDCQVNGSRITDRLLAPGITQYDKRMNYQTYDVTKYLKTGENGIGVTLASGWWSDGQTFALPNYNYFGDKEALLAKIVLTYTDGSREVRVTNTTDWKYYGDGPYTYAGLFYGEQLDGRKMNVYRDYSKPEFDNSTWEAPVEYQVSKIPEWRSMPVGFGRSWPAVNEQEPELIGAYDAPVYIVDTRKAVTRMKAAEDTYIYDLQQEMAGVPRITLHEKAGTQIIIRYAEVLYPDMDEYKENAGELMLENYRDATSTDYYICCGEEGEVYQPRFTFHGYRYIEISGASNPPKREEVESLQYSSIVDMEGSFESSDPLLNRFAENVRWSQKCNFINIPTDCPQRNERMGWAGDTHVFCGTALRNSHLKQFYERNLEAMADLQTPEGQFPEIAPVGGGFGGVTYECASIFMTWELYEQYGDKNTIRRFYPGLKKYMEYMKDKGMPGAADFATVGPLGDWLAPEETDLMLMWNAFYFKEANLMSKMAEIIDEKEDAMQYQILAEEIKEFWNQTFIDPKTSRARTMEGKENDTQTAYTLALEFAIVKDKKAAGENLVRKTREVGHKVHTGFFGTGLLNQALTDAGYIEDAYKLMLQREFPSWIYPVTQGATTIWEHWDSFTKEKGFGGQNAMNSFNHYSLGSVLTWMYSNILGIQREGEHPGYDHFLLKPVPMYLEYAKGSVSTPYGTVKAGWEKKECGISYHCEIPVNTAATLVHPDGRTEELGSGIYDIDL